MALAPQAVKKAAAKVANVANCPFMRTNALSKESLSQPNVLNTASKICPFLNSALNNAQRCETCPELSFTQPAHSSSITSSVSALSSDLNSVPKRVSNSQYDEIFTAEVSKIRSEGRYRVFADLERHAGRYPLASFRPTPSSEPKQIVSWCSNDYLSIGQNPDVIKAMVTTAQQLGTGAGGTRNIAGTSHQHVLLEERLAKLHNKPSSLLFSSCYVANETVLTTMSKILSKNRTNEKPVVFSDRHNHASMIQGIRNGVWDKVLYPHNSLSALETELRKHSISKPKVIAFESVNSMEGTIAPLSDLVYLAKKYNCLTFCDEVHAVGLYGEFGAGGSERDGVMSEIDIISGTLGKAFGVFGGYVTSNSESFVDSMRLSCPGFIFTTSLPPAVCSALNKSVEILSSKTGSQLRSKMHRNAFNLQKKLRSLRLPVMKTVSHITPVLVGDSVLCKAVSDCLIQEYGIYVQPINYPTVAKGSERLRITPLPVHDSEMMEYFVGSLDKVWTKFNLPRKDFDTEFEVDVESLSEKDFEVGGEKVYAYFENEYKQNWRRETEEGRFFERRQRNFAAAA